MAIRIRCIGCGFILATKVPQEDTILSCPSCKGRYSIRGGFTRTTAFSIERQPQPYQCKYCEQSYGTPQALRSHCFKSHRATFEADEQEQQRIKYEVSKERREHAQWQKMQAT